MKTALGILLVLLCGGLGAVEEPAGITLSPATSSVNEGEPLELIVETWWPAEWHVAEAADPLLAFAEVYVRHWQEDPAWRDGDRYRQRWRLSIQAEEAGPWPLPRVGMYWYDTDGALQHQRSDPVVIMVDAPALEADLGPGMGLWQPELPLSAIWWYVGAGVLVLLLIMGMWWYWRRRHYQPSPHERLQQALAVVADADQVNHGMAILAQALRSFASEHWGLPLRGASVKEVQQMLAEHPQQSLRDLSLILTDIDRNRWAPQGPSAEHMRAVHLRAQQWLEQLRQSERKQ
ncbi:MAG: DUF4381 family protein [Planctomycetota bacterium]|nr:MAG: DUF4381 family protein [Planctomycetota bacterium]